MKEKSINLWILFLFVILGSSVINRANAMENKRFEEDLRDQQRLGKISSKKMGYIKVFDIREDKDEQNVLNRVVQIDFEKDPGFEYLQHCLKYREPYSTPFPIDIEWCPNADDLALLVAKGPIISNICIGGIRNQEDFDYTKNFFKKIRHKSIECIAPGFHPSENSTNKIKEYVKNYQEIIKKELDSRIIVISKNNEFAYEKIADYEQFMAELNENYGIANGNGDSSDDHPFNGNFYEGDYSDEDFSS